MNASISCTFHARGILRPHSVTMSVRTNTHVLFPDVQFAKTALTAQNKLHPIGTRCVQQARVDLRLNVVLLRFCETHCGHLLLQCLIELVFTRDDVFTHHGVLHLLVHAFTDLHNLYPLRNLWRHLHSSRQLAVAHMLQHCSGTPSTKRLDEPQINSSHRHSLRAGDPTHVPRNSGVNSCQAGEFFGTSLSPLSCSQIFPVLTATTARTPGSRCAPARECRKAAQCKFLATFTRHKTALVSHVHEWVRFFPNA